MAIRTPCRDDQRWKRWFLQHRQINRGGAGDGFERPAAGLEGLSEAPHTVERTKVDLHQAYGSLRDTEAACRALRLIPVFHDDLPAPLRQRIGRMQADARRCAGDDHGGSVCAKACSVREG